MDLHKQLRREAQWALYLSLFYLLGWALFAYFSPNGKGLLGFPLWFELACIYLPLFFVPVIYLVIKRVYVDIDLENAAKGAKNDK